MASVTHVGEETAEDKKESTIPLDMVDEENLDIGPKMYLDAARVYTKFCHVTAGNELVNSQSSELSMNTIRFRHYYGTCGQPIPLVTPSETPPSIRYWETHIRVGVKRPVWSVMEMAVLEEGQVDRKYLACYQPRSWGINISRCDKHKGICTKVYKEGEYISCSPNTMTEAPGTQTTLHYGVVLDVRRGRVAFIDIDKEVVLAKLDVEFREVLYPMFSVGPWPDYFTVVMKLVSGEDITMTKTKKLLIRSALT